MPHYRCRYIDSDSVIKKLTGYFPSQDAVNDEVCGFGGTVLDIVEKPALISNKLQPKTLQKFTEILATLLTSGHSLSNSLKIYSSLDFTRKSEQHAAELARRLNKRIEKGSSLAQALRDSSVVVPEVYLGLINAGERIGNLAIIMGELQSWLNISLDLKSKIVSAALYPLLILVSLAAVMLVFVFVLLPDFIQTLGSLSQASANQLIQTSAVFGMSTVTALCLIAIVPFSIWAYNSSKSRLKELAIKLEKTILQVPILGRLIQLREMVSMQFSLELLTSGGVPLEEAVHISGQSLTLIVYKTALKKVQMRLVEGNSLSQSYFERTELPSELSTWARIGEETGDVTIIFGQLKQYYQQELNVLVQRVSDLVFPVLIIIVGILLLSVVTNIILPILNTVYASTGF